MDTDSFFLYIETDGIYKNIAEDVETRLVLQIMNYELNKPLPKGKNKKVIGLMKDELGRQIINKYIGLRAKIYSYYIDGSSEDKKAKETEKCVIDTLFRSN